MADNVHVANRRFDATENEALIGMARAGADAFGYTANLRIDRDLAQLLRLRVSQLNNCTYCLNLHYQAARQAGIPRAKIDTLTAWWETELHSEAERAALRYTEALTRAGDTDRGAGFQRFHDALVEHFGPEETLEIVGVVVNMNVWTRLKLAEGAMPGPADLAPYAAPSAGIRCPVCRSAHFPVRRRSSSSPVVDVTVEIDLVGGAFVRRREGRPQPPTSIWWAMDSASSFTQPRSAEPRVRCRVSLTKHRPGQPMTPRWWIGRPRLSGTGTSIHA